MKAYMLIENRMEHLMGTICFPCVQPDYGLIFDDELLTGVEHKSLTLSPVGNYPLFTCPVTDFVKIEFNPFDFGLPMDNAPLDGTEILIKTISGKWDIGHWSHLSERWLNTYALVIEDPEYFHYLPNKDYVTINKT